MSTYYKTEGIILSYRDVGEADRIVTCFTKEYGRVEFKAKAVRKIASKLRAGLEPFSLSWLEFVEGKRGYIVTEAIAVEKFFGGAAPKHENAALLGEVRDFFLAVIGGQEKDEKLWDYFVNTCRVCRDARLHRERFLARAREDIAMLAGYGSDTSLAED